MSDHQSSSGVEERQPLLQGKQEESFKDLRPHIKPLLSAFFISIVAGLNDGSLGTIIPRMKLYYDISNETISTLFLCSAFGFFISAGLNGYIVHRIGQLKTLYLGSALMLAAFVLIAIGMPFTVVACTFPFVGAGMALLDAAMNVYVANLPLATLMLNILHGINTINSACVYRKKVEFNSFLFFNLALYGIGAFISPKVSGFLLEHNYSWMGMYVFLAAVSVINIISITIGFYPVDFEEIRHDDDDTSKPNHGELTKLAILNKVTLIGATYILIYVGVEVTLGGWGFTWLTEGRHGEAGSMLQVMSGYWGGLAMGRILLGYLSGRFGEKLMITLFTMMIIGGLVIMMLSTDIVIDSAGNFYLFSGVTYGYH